MKEKILALDIGGTKLAAAVFGEDTVCARARRQTRAERGPDAVLERIVRLLDSVLKKAGARREDVSCIGVGCGGPLDSKTGIIYSPPNLPDWDAYPLKQNLEAQVHVPVFVENDANAAALAEFHYGAGRGYRNVFYITASTGIGAGLILDGRLYRGTNYSAGEFGHIVLSRNGPPCNCGGRGCLEALSSGTAIASRAEKLLHPKTLPAKTEKWTAREVAAAARAGNPAAQKVFMEAAQYLGLGIVTIIHLLNPEIVIIGGGLAQAGAILFDPIRRVVKRRAQRHLSEFVKIVPAELGIHAGLYGALAVAREKNCRGL